MTNEIPHIQFKSNHAKVKGIEIITLKDLKEEFANYKGSIEFFGSLSKSVKKIIALGRFS